jgi:hypothetical protein
MALLKTDRFDTKAAETTRLRPPIVVCALEALSNS